jgi:hypothetical protein
MFVLLYVNNLFYISQIKTIRGFNYRFDGNSLIDNLHGCVPDFFLNLKMYSINQKAQLYRWLQEHAQNLGHHPAIRLGADEPNLHHRSHKRPLPYYMPLGNNISCQIFLKERLAQFTANNRVSRSFKKKEKGK